MSYVDFTVRMKRKPDYWIAFVLLPSIFLVALSYGTFWIQRGAIPARAAFCFISPTMFSTSFADAITSIGDEPAAAYPSAMAPREEPAATLAFSGSSSNMRCANSRVIQLCHSWKGFSLSTRLNRSSILTDSRDSALCHTP